MRAFSHLLLDRHWQKYVEIEMCWKPRSACIWCDSDSLQKRTARYDGCVPYGFLLLNNLPMLSSHSVVWSGIQCSKEFPCCQILYNKFNAFVEFLVLSMFKFDLSIFKITMESYSLMTLKLDFLTLSLKIYQDFFVLKSENEVHICLN